jgi:hypothetical protein
MSTGGRLASPILAVHQGSDLLVVVQCVAQPIAKKSRIQRLFKYAQRTAGSGHSIDLVGKVGGSENDGERVDILT